MDDLFEFDDKKPETNYVPSNIDYEKISYGKYAYKRVQKLRRKGKRRGIQVPALGYELEKPEKPRLAFRIIAFVSAVIFIGILIGIGFLYNALIVAFSDLSGIGEFIKVMFKPDILSGSFGLSALPGILMVVVYLLIFILFALPLFAAAEFYGFVRDAFYMSKCSKEEFAKGNIVSSRILGLTSLIAVVTAIFIVLLIYLTDASVKLYLGLIYGGLLVALGGLIVLMIIEKRKCKKWFEGLDEWKKSNFIQHDMALRRVKRRLKNEKQILDDLSKM